VAVVNGWRSSSVYGDQRSSMGFNMTKPGADGHPRLAPPAN
jgi:hypothetical protein